jgi:hypothetical protein
MLRDVGVYCLAICTVLLAFSLGQVSSIHLFGPMFASPFWVVCKYSNHIKDLQQQHSHLQVCLCSCSCQVAASFGSSRSSNPTGVAYVLFVDELIVGTVPLMSTP